MLDRPLARLLLGLPVRELPVRAVLARVDEALAREGRAVGRVEVAPPAGDAGPRCSVVSGSGGLLAV
ncbi:hypothetical protein GCM10025868_01240 [Angustibacter aerolatus]|uniref:Uncharacterized protein n=1 Tax=Angustibacter aerolatus TaxID=1162965 RepID=A0ABQ6JCF2_9ACTN|nr:hypothetical protein GCM10025868_01240 [Angustibacter aerolatus]